MNISTLMHSPGTNTGSFRTHRPEDVELYGGSIFLSRARPSRRT